MAPFANIAVKVGDGEIQAVVSPRLFCARRRSPGSSQDLSSTRRAQQRFAGPNEARSAGPVHGIWHAADGADSVQDACSSAHRPKPDSAPAPAKDNARLTAIQSTLPSISMTCGLKLEPDGIRNDTLNMSMIVYDRTGRWSAAKIIIVQLNVKPDVYPVFQKNGVQLHGAVRSQTGITGCVPVSTMRERARSAQWRFPFAWSRTTLRANSQLPAIVQNSLQSSAVWRRRLSNCYTT